MHLRRKYQFSIHVPSTYNQGATIGLLVGHQDNAIKHGVAKLPRASIKDQGPLVWGSAMIRKLRKEGRSTSGAKLIDGTEKQN